MNVVVESESPCVKRGILSDRKKRNRKAKKNEQGPRKESTKKRVNAADGGDL